VKKKVESMKSSSTTSVNEVPSLLEMYLSSDHLDEKDVVGFALDLLLAGIDTVSLKKLCFFVCFFFEFVISYF